MAEDNNQNVFFNAEIKSDSPEKLLAVEGKPTKYYLFAQEYNAIGRALNQLFALIQLSPNQIQQILATGIKIDLGEIAESVVDTLNNLGEQSFGTLGTTFIVYTVGGNQYVYVFIGTPGDYGGDVPMSFEYLQLIYDGSLQNTSETLEYTCTIRVRGTLNPLITVYRNDFVNAELSVNVIRQSVGVYLATVVQAGAFTDRLYVFDALTLSDSYQDQGTTYTKDITLWSTWNTIRITTKSNGVLSDGVLEDYPLTIKAYFQ